MKNAAALVFGAFFCAAVLAAPKAELWARWQTHDAAGNATVNHAAWGDFLRRHLSEKDGVARLDYAGVAGESRQALRDYLAQLAAVDVDSLNRGEQLAFWINLYNALTVDVVLAHYPVASIRDISSGFLSSGPWSEKRFTVAGETVSLDDIEHRILRPIWRDPRLHYAVNCASIGCPNLAAEAFTAANAEALLEAGARAYVNHRRGAQVVDGRLKVSSIYLWFQEDFGGDDAGVIAHLRQYAEPPLAELLAPVQTIADDDYDWSLNAP